LDPTGSAARGCTFRSLAVIGLIAICFAPGFGQTAAPNAQLRTRVQQLFEKSQWQAIVDAVHDLPANDVDLDYCYGSALAQLGRWNDARKALLAGHRLSPRDKRFLLELAGVAFKQQRHSEAAAWLRWAERIDSTDAYTNDFLGTVYFVQGNLEAALKYWNRIDKPQIASVKPDHPLQIRPALLDRSLTFSPGGPLLLPDLLSSRARVKGLGVFVSPELQLAARDDAKFDVVLNLQERNAWGASKAAALVSTFSGVAYQTIYPEYFNLHHSAINFTSLFRWDAQKRRINAEVSGPLRGNPKRRYRIGLDLRNENWMLYPSGAQLGSLNLRREAVSAGITSFQTGRWDWSTGVEFSHRDYRSIDFGTALSPQLLETGRQLKILADTHYDIWRNPDHRVVLSESGYAQVARIWSQSTQIYSKLQGALLLHWFPKSQGDDYETRFQIRGGGAAGPVPFDELFALGLERDNDLWLRGHIGTRDGRKGSAPMGTQYVITNFEVDKRLYSNGFFGLKLSPFLDSGKISGSASALASQNYLWDIGLQLKVRILGQNLIFSWGKELRTDVNAWYFTKAQ